MHIITSKASGPSGTLNISQIVWVCQFSEWSESWPAAQNVCCRLFPRGIASENQRYPNKKTTKGLKIIILI